MNSTNAHACQHGDSRLRDHRHIDGYPVAFLRTFCLQDIGEFANLGVKFGIGDMAGISRVVTFPDNRGLVTALFQMTVEAVCSSVQRAIGKPANMKISRIIGHVADLGVRLDPVNALAVFGPEGVIVGKRFRIHGLIFTVCNQRSVNGRCRGFEHPVLAHPVSSGKTTCCIYVVSESPQSLV